MTFFKLQQIKKAIRAAHALGPVYDPAHLPLTPPSRYAIDAARPKRQVNSIKHFGRAKWHHALPTTRSLVGNQKH